MEDKKIRLDEYRKKLLEKRETEELKNDIINEFNSQNGKGLTSPTTPTTTEETRLLMEYIDRANLFNISKQNEKRGKTLKYRKFFKSKRNQQVEIYFKCGTQSLYTEGKVSTVGRDFVMLTNLKERKWIPYTIIESANIPFGIPNYSNTHQHYIFDNNLRQKLLYEFGETISKRDILRQQFFEETLQTNLDSWQETWVTVHLSENVRKIGKILSAENQQLILTFLKEKECIDLKDVKYVNTIRLTSLFSHVFKRFSNKEITH